MSHLTNHWSTRLALVALVLVLAAAPPAFAGSASTTLSVSATVANNCTISTSAVAFGNYDPLVANATTPLDQTGSVTITCTKGAVTTVGLDPGGNALGSTRRMAGGADLLTYELYKDSARTAVWGNSGADLLNPATAPSKAPRSFTIYGRVPAGQDVLAAAYADTVTATVNF